MYCTEKTQIKIQIDWQRRVKILKNFKITYCAANFSFAQLAKRKSLGRSKPATNSQAQAPQRQHTVWNISTISKSYRTAFYRNKLSTTRCE